MSSPAVLPPLPRAVLFDLDDTLVVFDAVCEPAWREVCARWAGRAGLGGDELHRVIQRTARVYWSDPERHRVGRLALEETRARLVAEALEASGVPDPELARGLARDYSTLQESRIAPFPDAFDTLATMSRAGVRMALVTNGNAELQRRKIVRFGLERFMAVFLVEGELGFGKPDRRVFERALEALQVSPRETWCVGDNLEWDVGGAQAVGIAGIWKDNRRRGVARGPVQPDRIIFELAELVGASPRRDPPDPLRA